MPGNVHREAIHRNEEGGQREILSRLLSLSGETDGVKTVPYFPEWPRRPSVESGCGAFRRSISRPKACTTTSSLASLVPYKTPTGVPSLISGERVR